MMWKHIIGQAVLQIVIILILLFWGENFIPETADALDLTVFASRP